MSGRSRSLLPLLLLVAACSTEVVQPGGEAASTRRVSQPIVNGVPSTATDDSVVLITITEASGGSTCSGTLIAPNLVITARHCVSTVGGTDCGTFTTQNVPSSMTVSVGVAPGAQLATAKTIFVDTAKSNSGCSNDIALFQLDRDVPNAKISKVRFSTLTVGETARTTGYGEDGSGKLTSGRFVRTGINRPSIFGDTSSHEKLFTETAAAAGHPLSKAAAVPDADGGAPVSNAAPPRPTDTTSSYRGQQGSSCSTLTTTRASSSATLAVLAVLAVLGVLARRRRLPDSGD